ncbi:SWIM zinc finger family protein [Kaarinaea lacus]
MSAAIDYTYQYRFESDLRTQNSVNQLSLATCDGHHNHPYFFDGRVRNPRMLGNMLLVLTEVVRTHFFLPRPPILDPVLTSNESMLRLEGFSGCCGVYARVDLPADAFDGEIKGRGTTNVDFNNPMRAALLRLKDDDEVRFAVGREEIALSHGDEKVIEKKVKLPLRWIKGFSEVQAYQPTLQLKLQVSAAEALRFIRSLPKSGAPKRPSYVISAGRSIRLSQREQKGAVRLAGTHRVRILEPLLINANSLNIWCDENNGTSAWEVQLDQGRFFLMISPDVFRGFSGEGQNLEALASSGWQDVLPQIRAQLAWQNQIDIQTLSKQLGLDTALTSATLAVLGARGLAGYDVTSGHYFHRELPFELDKVEQLQPRLKAARALVEKNAVAPNPRQHKGVVSFSVKGTDVNHHVRLHTDGDKCTCPWFSKHQGERGPCKHILAAKIVLENDANK